MGVTAFTQRATLAVDCVAWRGQLTFVFQVNAMVHSTVTYTYFSLDLEAVASEY